MLEVLGWAVLAVVVAGGLCALAVVFLPAGEQIAPALRDEPVWSLPPNRDLAPADVDSVRLPVALRGYRFAETDLLLDRLAAELRARDVEIERLRGGYVVKDAPGETPSGTAPTAEQPVETLDDRLAEPAAELEQPVEPTVDQSYFAPPDGSTDDRG